MHPPLPFFSDALDTSEMRINSRSHPALAPSIAPTHTGETRQKKEFSHRQLELPKAREMTCRHCNEHDKFEKKQERRRSLDEAHNKHKNNAEIHNKGAQVHQSTFHSAPVAWPGAPASTRHLDETQLCLHETTRRNDLFIENEIRTN